MKTQDEIIDEIMKLAMEIDTLKKRHSELHSVDDSEEWEQSFLTLSVKNSRLDTLRWVMSFS
jgi:hypothetical protein